jgi:hypothetical protein
VDLDGRVQPNGSAAGANSTVQLIILIPDEPLVKVAKSSENVFLEKTKGNCVCRPLQGIEAIACVANPKRVGSDGLNQSSSVATSTWMSDNNPSSVVGLRSNAGKELGNCADKTHGHPNAEHNPPDSA